MKMRNSNDISANAMKAMYAAHGTIHTVQRPRTIAIAQQKEIQLQNTKKKRRNEAKNKKRKFICVYCALHRDKDDPKQRGMVDRRVYR